MNVADAVLIEIGERERLQMLERSVSQVAVDVDFRAERQRESDIIDKPRKDDSRNIKQNKPHKCVKRVLRNEVIKRIALEKRYENVYRRTAKSEHYHSDKSHSVFFQERKKSAYPEKRKRFFVFCFGFHIFAASSSESDWLSYIF